MQVLRMLLRDLRYGRAVSPRGVRPSAFALPRTWEERTALVVASPDNELIPRVPEAGMVHGQTQVMHNGIIVRTDGYYGTEQTNLLKRNRGVHEPQEERVFAEVLPHIEAGGMIVELGAYWSYYSSWFLRDVHQSRAILVEPDPANLEAGRDNLRYNGLADRAEIIQAFVGSMPRRYRPPGVRAITVDEIVQQRSLDRIDILHADVQGSECRMLKGAANALRRQLIQWLFISTHSMHKHAWCRQHLVMKGLELVADADLPESYSYDGLLVFKHPQTKGPRRIEVSQHPYPGM